MSAFMVGMNTYNNGVKPETGHSSVLGRPGQDGREAEAAGRTSGERIAPREQKLPWADKAQKEDNSGDGFRKKEPGEECQTCKNRKYKDGSNENVSFKAAAHISPEAAAGRVRAHEGEHVANAYSKAAEKGGKVLSVSVRIETSVCPECGKSYVSGGTTSTKISYPADSEKAKEKNALADSGDTDRNIPQEESRGASAQGRGRTKPLEEFEMERY